MPPSISAALLKRRGIDTLTLPQITRLYENRTEVEKILTQFEELREGVLLAEKAAQQVISEAERRMGEAVAAEAALAKYTAAAEAANASRVAETDALRKSLDERAEKLAADIAEHNRNVAEARGGIRRQTVALESGLEELRQGQDELATRSAELDARQAQVQKDADDVARLRSAVQARQDRLHAANVQHGALLDEERGNFQ